LKSKREFRTKKHPQKLSYKVQNLQAAVLLQSGSNRLRSLVADLVILLQNSCWPSRTAIEKQTRIQNKKTSTKIILQGSESASCCSVAERRSIDWYLLMYQLISCSLLYGAV
jgi:hypothetical protein